MNEDLNKAVTKEIQNFWKNLFDKYPQISRIKIRGNKQSLAMSTIYK